MEANLIFIVVALAAAFLIVSIVRGAMYSKKSKSEIIAGDPEANQPAGEVRPKPADYTAGIMQMMKLVTIACTVTIALSIILQSGIVVLIVAVLTLFYGFLKMADARKMGKQYSAGVTTGSGLALFAWLPLGLAMFYGFRPVQFYAEQSNYVHGHFAFAILFTVISVTLVLFGLNAKSMAAKQGGTEVIKSSPTDKSLTLALTLMAVICAASPVISVLFRPMSYYLPGTTFGLAVLYWLGALAGTAGVRLWKPQYAHGWAGGSAVGIVFLMVAFLVDGALFNDFLI